MMKRKLLYAAASFSFVAITQLLFFWLVPTSSSTFWATYPFYTVLALAHTVLFYYICSRYKYPACFPFALTGSIIVIIQIVSSILMGSFEVKVRTAIFVEAIVVAVYVLLSTLLIGIASRESIASEEPVEVVIQYPASAPAHNETYRRKPQPVQQNNTNN